VFTHELTHEMVVALHNIGIGLLLFNLIL
jgi:hypothetical protein